MKPWEIKKPVQRYWRRHPVQRRVFVGALSPILFAVAIATVIFMAIRAAWLELQDESEYQAKWIWKMLSD